LSELEPLKSSLINTSAGAREVCSRKAERVNARIGRAFISLRDKWFYGSDVLTERAVKMERE
jgi:hypothetical protein